MKAIAKDDVTGALSIFIDTILPIMEDLVSLKIVGKRFSKKKLTRNADVSGENKAGQRN